jgi:lipopolysaccharide transport system ATP-binding protein
MEKEVLIEVNGVSKKFSRTLRGGMRYGLKEIGKALTGIGSSSAELRKDEFWAVKAVNFQLRRGECLGLIGHNGAGKSTLLKMLNGLIRPDEGSITMRGKVGGLIELGAGFNPLLSGRENIYINGQLIGFSKREVEKKLDAILSFAEIGEFIDAPIQNYSSGMKVRLGFAVAAQMEPDILLIDEVLAVGDVGFRIKCYTRIVEMLNHTAVILVSHSMPSIGRICSSAMLMNKGEIEYGSEQIHTVIERYNSHFTSSASTRLDSFTTEVSLGKVIFNKSEELKQTIDFGSAFELSAMLDLTSAMENLVVSLVFIDREEKIIASTRSREFSAGPGIQLVNFKLKTEFTSGEYSLHLVVSQKEEKLYKTLIRMGNAVRFSVINCPVINASPILLTNEFSTTSNA